MNSTILRFIYVCILLSYVAGCATTAGDLSVKSTQNAEIETNKKSDDTLFADMCLSTVIGVPLMLRNWLFKDRDISNLG